MADIRSEQVAGLRRNLQSTRQSRHGERQDAPQRVVLGHPPLAAHIGEQPLRPDIVAPLVDRALSDLSAEFHKLYADRPAVDPAGEAAAGAALQAFYSIRSERQLMEQLNSNLLFGWFPRVGPKGRPRTGSGLGIEEPVWDVTVFPKNRDRLFDGHIAAKFFAAVRRQPSIEALLSDEHFTVDGTRIEAWPA